MPGQARHDGRESLVFAQHDERELAINILPMTCFDDIDDENFVFNAVYNPVLSMPHTVSIMSGQFLAPGRPWIVGKMFDLLCYVLSIFLPRDGLYFLYGRWFD